MNSYLKDIFEKTNENSLAALRAIFGRGSDEDTKTLEAGWGKSQELVPGNTGNSTHLISKILHGGEFIVPTARSQLGTAIRAGLETVRYGVIGNYLTSLQFFVLVWVSAHHVPASDVANELRTEATE